MKKETGKKIIDNKIKKSGDNIKKSNDKIAKSNNKIKKSNDKIMESDGLTTQSRKSNPLVISNISFLVISMITFFILFFTTFVIKNNLPILGLNPSLVSPFYEAFIKNKIIVLNLTWFAYVAIVLVLLVVVIGFLSFFMTLKKKKQINKQMFINSLIIFPLTSFLLVFILIIGLIPVDTIAWEKSLITQPGNIVIDVFDNISIFWIYYLNGPASLTTLGLVFMIISAILGSMIAILVVLPFVLGSIFSLNKNKMNWSKEKISRIKTDDTKESFRDFKKRIKIVNEEKEKKSKEDLISKNKKTFDNVDLKYLENDEKETLNIESISGNITDLNEDQKTETKNIRSSMIDIKTSMIDIENDDGSDTEIDGFLDEIIGKDK